VRPRFVEDRAVSVSRRKSFSMALYAMALAGMAELDFEWAPLTFGVSMTISAASGFPCEGAGCLVPNRIQIDVSVEGGIRQDEREANCDQPGIGGISSGR